MLRGSDPTPEPYPQPTQDTRWRELVIVVGGYQSCSCIEDGSFDALKSRLVAAGYDVERFGQDPRFPYDTFGAIEPNAINLRDEVRERGRSYAGVHIVTHSMGGVVADQAFADGLSANDGVLTYVSWSAPHNGSASAMALDVVQRAAGGHDELLQSGLRYLGMDPATDATRDLATVRPVAPPAGVVRLDLRESTDALVIARDAVDPGVPSRVLTGPLEGHGGILSDPNAIDMTVSTIAARRVPPEDRRAQALAHVAGDQQRLVNIEVLAALCVLTVALCFATKRLRAPIEAIGWAASHVVPPSKRKRCA